MTTTSTVKMIEMLRLKYATTGAEAYFGSVSRPASPAAKRIATVTPFWNLVRGGLRLRGPGLVLRVGGQGRWSGVGSGCRLG